MVSKHPVKLTQPDPVVTHPVWYEAQASLVVVDEGASVHIFKVQDVETSAEVPLHLPSYPIYPSQEVVVPEYPEQRPRAPIHPFPVLLHAN